MRKNKAKLRNFFFISITGCYLIIYVLLYLKILYIGYKTEKLKEEYEMLNMLNKSYNLEFIKLITPENLKKIAKEKNIELCIPQNWNFIEIRKEDEKSIKETEVLEAGTK
ncbi:MAG: hypothetical protein NC833_00080 [Candidatus Omnitrophica bacterium]|nr:hypothetical protein [Candidatus Omnitrophota bacterium]